MRILAPVSSVDEVEMLVKSGASELYCGVIPSRWAESFGSLSGASRRTSPRANLEGIDALAALIARAHALEARVFLTLNASSYSEEMYGSLVDLATDATKAGVDAFIVADLTLLLRLAKMPARPALHLSSLGRGTNRESIAFFRDLGVSRVILPRHTSLRELAALRQAHPDVELEVFILNDGCVYEEALCMTTHELGAFCTTPWSFRARNQGANSDSFDRSDLDAHLADYDRWRSAMSNAGCSFTAGGLPSGPCGLCALSQLRDSGVDALKIVGREATPYRKLRSVQMLRAVLEQLELGASPEEIVSYARGLRATPELCDQRYMCYFRS
jgi:putative protease